MKAIAVDDEINMLETLKEAIQASSDIESVASFSSCSGALAYVSENNVNVAFLDINMRGMGGLELAVKISELRPKCKIVFCTGYGEYALDAFQIHASGYLMKPITAQSVQKEIDHIKYIHTGEKLLTVKCFGYFEVLHHGKSLAFKRTRTKELFALLVDRGGAGITAKQICAVLFPSYTDENKNIAYLRQFVMDLKNTLKEIGAEEIFQHDTPYYRIDTNKIECDYLNYLEKGQPEFRGEYMTQYSWAEETCATL